MLEVVIGQNCRQVGKIDRVMLVAGPDREEMNVRTGVLLVAMLCVEVIVKNAE